MPIRREYVAGLYRDLLGREGSDSEIEGHLNNPGGEEGLRQFFLGSPEYTSQHGGQATWQDVNGVVTPTSTQTPTNSTLPVGGGDGTTTRPSDNAPPPPPPTPPTQFSNPNNYDYSAFDTSRPQNPSVSAKDAYAWLSAQAPPAPLSDRQAMQQWFNQYIAPGMNSLGHRVIRVDENGFEYENHEGRFYVDYAQNLGAPAGTRDQRLHWNATPADEATRRRYATQGGSTGTGSGTGSSPMGAFLRPPSGAGAGTNYSGPGGQGVMTGPLQQVGQDPFSSLITNSLAEFILNGGQTAFGDEIQEALLGLIESGGAGPNSNAIDKRFESARELMAKGERTALNDARAALANRGLLSEPGEANRSGAEAGTIGRVMVRNAEEFARNLRDIGIEQDDANGTRLMQALSLATGMNDAQARTYLAALGSATDRQNMLAQIALESLEKNMAWNMFLAEFGLKRDQAMYMIQNGQIDQLLPYMAMFLQLAQSTQRGYV